MDESSLVHISHMHVVDHTPNPTNNRTAFCSYVAMLALQASGHFQLLDSIMWPSRLSGSLDVPS